MARDEKEIEKGLAYLHKSLKVAEESGNESLRQTAEAFSALDHTIASRKLKGLLLAKKIDPLLEEGVRNQQEGRLIHPIAF
jgi:hypothetical protein